MTGQVTSKAHDRLVADGNILWFHHHPAMFNFPGSNVARLLHHAIARRGKCNIDATLGKPDRCHCSNPMLTFAKYLKSNTVFQKYPPSGALFWLYVRLLLHQGTCKTSKSLEISPWNHQEWGVLMFLKNSRYIWTFAHLCRWNNAAWGCRGRWAPCHQRACRFWRGNKRWTLVSDHTQFSSDWENLLPKPCLVRWQC